MPNTEKIKSGRPPKFCGPRRPITVTLPESTLARLASIDTDRARAIVKATEAAMPLDAKQERQVDLLEVSPGLAVIIVGPCQHLQKIKWLRLVEVSPTRFLLSIPLDTSIDSLELALIELLEDAKNEWDHSLLTQLRDLIRRLRHRDALSKGEMLFVDTLSKWTTNGALDWDDKDLNKRRREERKKIAREVLDRANRAS